MTKIDALRRYLLPCFSHTTTTTPPTTTKKRLSTSLRDDLDNDAIATAYQNQEDQDSQSSTSPTTENRSSATAITTVQPRPSKSMVIGTIFGPRRGHVWFCIQHDRLSAKPTLLLELSIPTHQLVREMRFGLVRICLECGAAELATCPLRSVPVWSLHCNGRKLGFAARRKASEKVRLMLKTMQSTTVGAGVMPSGFGSSDSEEVMYMRANYEHVVGGADSESFHLINPDVFPGQELSVFLLSKYADCRALAWMLEGKAVVRETDMPEAMQSHVMELAYKALDLHEVSDCRPIAHYIKQNFDEAYGPAWHCVVGKDFGSCITFLCGSFIFFHVEMMEFLIFKDGTDSTENREETIGVVLQKPNKSDS